MSSLEQQARDMLADMGVEDAQQMTAGELVPLANVLSENARLRAELDVVRSTLNASDAVLSENLKEKARLRADLTDAHRHIDEAGRVAADAHTEVERLRAALAAAPRWVSVAERLPGPRKDDDDLLARLENGTRVEAMHDGSSWWEFDHELQDWIPLVGVTHWYQVPAPEVTP